MLLQLLTEDRRKWHRELKNQNRKQQTYEVGDLVLVCKQVKSDAKAAFLLRFIQKYVCHYLGSQGYLIFLREKKYGTII